MAYYAISKKGIESLGQMGKSLCQASENINTISNQFYNHIEDNSEGLGIYQKAILAIIRDILKKNQETKVGIDYLSQVKIPEIMEKIEILLNMGLGDDTSSDDDDEPRQKRKILKM